MSTLPNSEFNSLRSQIEQIETSFNYIKNKVNEPSKLGRGEKAKDTIQSIQNNVEKIRGEISERIEITQMNNNLCSKLEEESELIIKQIQLAHERLQKQYGFSFEDESEERSENGYSEARPFSSFNASPLAGPGNQGGEPSGDQFTNTKCRRLNFDELNLRTPFATSTCRKRNTLTPGVRLLPPSPNFFLK